jgi:hypothetical protein
MTYLRRTRGLYTAGGKGFRLSRSKIDLFINCPRCFVLDRRYGLVRPDGPPFTLNVAVDHLLKKEFDTHRAAGRPHPLMTEYGVDAVPFRHKDLDDWRENFVGVQHLHKQTGMTVTGAVDDVWVDPEGNLIVVDYKATAKDGDVTLEDTPWHNQYRRQMEVYQWLLRQEGFPVSNRGYFVYVNGKKDKAAFDGKLEFSVKIIPYDGNDSWVEKTLVSIKAALDDPRIPKTNPSCDFCGYIDSLSVILKTHAKKDAPPREEAAGGLFAPGDSRE